MIYVSFVEIFTESREHFAAALGEQAGSGGGHMLPTTIFFFAGMVVIGLLDLVVHHLGHEPDPSTISISESELADAAEKGDVEFCQKRHRDLRRASLVAALAIMLHNMYERIPDPDPFDLSVADPKV